MSALTGPRARSVMARPSRYSADFRARAMRLVAEAKPEHDTEWAAITSVAHKLGVSSLGGVVGKANTNAATSPSAHA
jgi:transposase-like protein